MKQQMKEDSEAMQEEVSNVGESSKKDEEYQEKMKQQSSTSSLGGKRSEDKQENGGCEFLGTPKCKKRHEVTREKKKPGGMKVKN